MTAPLVLYQADDLDARAGAEQLRERWPGAELVAVESPDALFDAMSRDWPSVVWVLGLGHRSSSEIRDVRAIDPTPTASIVMQVWRRHSEFGCACRLDLHPQDADVCKSGGHRREPPPWWLRYLDDAVCGREMDGDAKTCWAWLESFGVDAATVAMGYDEPHDMMLFAGGAILRARERWEAQAGADCDACDRHVGSPADDLVREIARLRAERDHRTAWIRSALSHVEDCYGGPHCGWCGETEGHDECLGEVGRELAGVGRG
jgi:hypothetical protein